MADVVNDSLAFALADVLDTRLEFEDGLLKAKIEKAVRLSGILFTVRGTIVSQHLTKTNHMLLVRLSGNLLLGLCATKDAKYSHITNLRVCNLAKGLTPEGLLEDRKPRNVTAFDKLLDPAIVRRFTRIGSARWQAA